MLLIRFATHLPIWVWLLWSTCIEIGPEIEPGVERETGTVEGDGDRRGGWGRERRMGIGEEDEDRRGGWGQELSLIQILTLPTNREV